jgi:hypothetical protein
MTNENVAAAVENLREAVAITICNPPLLCSTHRLCGLAAHGSAPLPQWHLAAAPKAFPGSACNPASNHHVQDVCCNPDEGVPQSFIFIPNISSAAATVCGALVLRSKVFFAAARDCDQWQPARQSLLAPTFKCCPRAAVGVEFTCMSSCSFESAAAHAKTLQALHARPAGAPASFAHASGAGGSGQSVETIRAVQAGNRRSSPPLHPPPFYSPPLPPTLRLRPHLEMRKAAAPRLFGT